MYWLSQQANFASQAFVAGKKPEAILDSIAQSRAYLQTRLSGKTDETNALWGKRRPVHSSGGLVDSPWLHIIGFDSGATARSVAYATQLNGIDMVQLGNPVVRELADLVSRDGYKYSDASTPGTSPKMRWGYQDHKFSDGYSYAAGRVFRYFDLDYEGAVGFYAIKGEYVRYFLKDS